MHVGVIGAGTMGRGIAHASAAAGHSVALHDADGDALAAGVESIRETLDGGIERGKVTPEERDAALARISTAADLDAAASGADLVIEAVPEDLDLKREVFEAVEAAAPAGAVLATNTSSLSVTKIAGALERPGRFLGLHFFNPVHALPLVEVVVGARTTEGTVEFAREFVESIDKEPAVVTDSPGFASSRLGVALGVEATRMVEEGVASPRHVDRVMELGYNHPMGPLELTDVVGLDVRLEILEYLREELGERFRPPQLLKRKVRAGKLGRKTGEGFYRWEDGEAVAESGDYAG